MEYESDYDGSLFTLHLFWSISISEHSLILTIKQSINYSIISTITYK